MNRLGRLTSILFRGLFAVGVLASAHGCKHNQGESVVVTGEGKRLSADAIDQDPLALLPANPVALVWLDAQAFFASPFGDQVDRLASGYLPLGQEAGFVPRRDLVRVTAGVYSTSGADAVAVVTGTFQPDAIVAAADRNATTPLGVPVVHSHYANNDVFTAGNVGFTVVTAHTLLVGSETGMRRALDRIRDNRLSREIPDWMAALLASPQAAAVAAVDLSSQPQVAAFARQLPFLQGLRTARLLANFQAPGVNLAGALTYPDTATASSASGAIRSGAQTLSLMALPFGLAGPLQGLQVQVAENDVQFATTLDASTIARLFSMIPQARTAR